MILKTNAIPLYFTSVQNTSRIVTWMTARYGKLSTIIKGEQRKKSHFVGQYELFSTTELVFYDRTDRGIHIAKECSLITRRPGFRTNWKACAAAGYISALFAKTTLRHGHEPGRFAFFEEMLMFAERYGHSPAFLVWFDLKFSEFQGQMLQLDDNDGEADRRVARRFSPEHGGVIDPEYANQNRIQAAPLSVEALDVLREWQEAPTPQSVLATPINLAHLKQIERVMEKFVGWQYDLPPHVRRKAVQTVRHQIASSPAPHDR